MKTCISCAYFEGAGQSGSRRCGAKLYRNTWDGTESLGYCYVARREESQCGQVGRWWRERNGPLPAPIETAPPAGPCCQDCLHADDFGHCAAEGAFVNVITGESSMGFADVNRISGACGMQGTLFIPKPPKPF
jgi:hypothetical protein